MNVKGLFGAKKTRKPSLLSERGYGVEQKRADVRMDALVMGEWRLAPDGKGVGEFQKASLKDISRGGCSLITARRLREGCRVELRLMLGSGAPLALLGDVMRTRDIPSSGKFDHGLCFIGLKEAGTRAIAEFINRRHAEWRSRGLA